MLIALRVGLSAVLMALGCLAQSSEERVFYIAKPNTPGEYHPPMKPLTRLADLRARHHGQTNWRELVIDDGNSKAYMIQEGPGAKYARRLYTDSPAWWAVLEGHIRFEIEKPNGGFDLIEARKGSWVFAPERMLHSLEVIGEEPAIRFEVTLYEATPVFEERPRVEPGKTTSYIPVRVSAGPNPLDVPAEDGQPWLYHINAYDLAKENAGKPKWYRPAMRKNRVRSNFICGSPTAEPDRAPGYRGHFHADFAEFWVVMLGTLEWNMEGQAAPLSVTRETLSTPRRKPFTWRGSTERTALTAVSRAVRFRARITSGTPASDLVPEGGRWLTSAMFGLGAFDGFSVKATRGPVAFAG